MANFECPVNDCEQCEYHRTESWCAQAIPEHKGPSKEYKIYMEGFWDAINWCEQHYKDLEEYLEELANENDRLREGREN